MSANPNDRIPDFQDAENQLKEFLISQNFSDDILWVLREDVASRKGCIYVKLPLSDENSSVTESIYERGRQRNLGIRIEVLCVLDGKPCCYVWVPKNESDAEENGMLMSKFILSIPANLRRSQSVRNPLLWQLYKLLEDEPEWLSHVDRLPLRKSQVFDI